MKKKLYEYKTWSVLKLLERSCHITCDASMIFVIVCAKFTGFIVTGASTFMSKYLERQFSVAPSKANMLIGIVVIYIEKIRSCNLFFQIRSILFKTKTGFRMYNGSNGWNRYNVQWFRRSTVPFKLYQNFEVLHSIANVYANLISNVSRLL